VAAVVILLIVLGAILAPWIAPADPYRASMLRRLRPVGDALYALGSDELGRDMLSRLIYGGRLSLAARIVESAVKDQFDHWLAGNPTQANRLLDWVVERADERIGTVRLRAVKKW
jgi:hypothetical protein